MPTYISAAHNKPRQLVQYAQSGHPSRHCDVAGLRLPLCPAGRSFTVIAEDLHIDSAANDQAAHLNDKMGHARIRMKPAQADPGCSLSRNMCDDLHACASRVALDPSGMDYKTSKVMAIIGPKQQYKERTDIEWETHATLENCHNDHENFPYINQWFGGLSIP